jgi:LmbE family N-acetylglucosaminyl deacetylase
MPPRIAESRRLLAISPHLDDVALSVGGIVARTVASGADVFVATCLPRMLRIQQCRPL